MCIAKQQLHPKTNYELFNIQCLYVYKVNDNCSNLWLVATFSLFKNSLQLRRLQDPLIAFSHRCQAVCCCSQLVRGYRLNVFSFTTRILALSSLFFPHFPFTLDSLFSSLENSTLMKFMEKFGLEQLLSLSLYNSSGVACFSIICFAADGDKTYLHQSQNNSYKLVMTQRVEK